MMNSPHWRDPMQAMFTTAALFAQGASSFMRIAGAAFVCIGMGLIFIVGGIFAYAIIPVISDTPLQWFLHSITAVVLLFNIYFNYALCVATNPGFVEKLRVIPVAPGLSIEEEEQEQESNESDGDGDAKTDEDALIQRPRRSTSSLPATTTATTTTTTTTMSALPRLSFVTRIQEPPLIQIDPARRMRGDPNTSGLSYCRSCRMSRPQRAHHCSVCNRCVEHMDHHCPWVNNCIGRRNYRYFISFLAWLSVGCLYAALVSFTPAYGALTRQQYDKLIALFRAPLVPQFHAAPLVYLQFAFCIAVSAGLAVTLLLGWHIYLVLTAQTSVELQINRSQRHRRLHGGRAISPYTQGSLHANWESVFGPCAYKILGLLPSTALPPAEHTKKSVRTTPASNYSQPEMVV